MKLASNDIHLLLEVVDLCFDVFLSGCLYKKKNTESGVNLKDFVFFPYKRENKLINTDIK